MVVERVEGGGEGGGGATAITDILRTSCLKSELSSWSNADASSSAAFSPPRFLRENIALRSSSEAMGGETRQRGVGAERRRGR